MILFPRGAWSGAAIGVTLAGSSGFVSVLSSHFLEDFEKYWCSFFEYLVEFPFKAI